MRVGKKEKAFLMTLKIINGGNDRKDMELNFIERFKKTLFYKALEQAALMR